MKILITTECYHPTINGVVTSVINLQDQLIKSGHDVKILTLAQSGESYIKDDVIYIASKPAQIIYPDARVSFVRRNQVIQMLDNWKPDIIHTQSEFSTFMIATKLAKKMDIPIIHTYHTIYEDYTHYFSPVKKWGRKAVKAITNRILKHTECVIAPSEKVFNLLMNYGVNKEIKVIPTGIDLDKFHLVSKSTVSDIRKQLGISDKAKILITVGRVAKEKNHEEIVEYFSRMNRKDIKLVIVGDGPNRKDLETYVKALGIDERVVFTGMVAQELVGAYYQLGDIFISASKSETQGLTYIEALANGIPIICRKDPCLEGVVYKGINGYQYENYEEFKYQVNEMFEKSKASLNADIKNGVQDKYSLYGFAQKVEQAYINVITSYELNKNAKEIYRLS